MSNPLLDQALVHTIGWALIQFTWQGALIGGATALALGAIGRQKAATRYLVACSGLMVMLLAAVSSVFFAGSAGPTHAVAVGGPAGIVSAMPVDRILSVAVVGWMLGVALLSIRLIAACVGIERMKRATQEVDVAVSARLRSLIERLAVRRAVRVVTSRVVHVPTVVGCVRPVILLPVSVVTALPVAHLDAVLAHELAHVRRHDYLVNALQSIVETLLFYHPAVWWCSHQIRIEREHCCDDLVVGVCGDRAGYAAALVQLEEMRGLEPMLSLNATGGRLIDRIRRVLGREPVNDRRPAPWMIVAALIAIIGAVLVTPALTSAAGDRPAIRGDSDLQEQVVPPAPPDVPQPPAVPAPAVPAAPPAPILPPDPPVVPVPPGASPAAPEVPIPPLPPLPAAPRAARPVVPAPPLPPMPGTARLVVPAPPLPPLAPAPQTARPAVPASPVPPAPPGAGILQIDPSSLAAEIQRASQQLAEGFEELRRATQDINAKQQALQVAEAELAKMRVETLANNARIQAIQRSIAEVSAAAKAAQSSGLDEAALRKEVEAILKQIEALGAR